MIRMGFWWLYGSNNALRSRLFAGLVLKDFGGFRF